MMGHDRHRLPAGQAMTEMLVTASLVLVPLLLLIPLLGKYIDIKHATIQAARYEAWEYTAWYGNNKIRTGPWSSGERSSGFTNLKGKPLAQPVKSVSETQKESRQRFFSSTRSPITDMDKSVGWMEANANGLWKDHRQNLLWDGDVPAGHLPKSSKATPDYSGGVLNTLLKILDAVFGAIAYAMQLVGSKVGFTAINTNGLAVSDVTVPVSAPAGLIDFATITDKNSVDNSTPAMEFDFEAGAAVLTDGWNAGGVGHTVNQVGGITPTKILGSLVDTLLDSVPGLGTAWDVVTLLIPEWRRCNPSINHFMDESPVPDVPDSVAAVQQDGSLWLGYINIDAVHPDRLEIGGTQNCPNGICDFDYETYTPCE